MPDMEGPRSYAHWMLREIYDQPVTLAATLDRYVNADGFRADVCAPVREWLLAARSEIVIAASGSSRHAGMVAELMIEDLSGIAVDVEYASEYCYRSEKSLNQRRMSSSGSVSPSRSATVAPTPSNPAKSASL